MREMNIDLHTTARKDTAFIELVRDSREMKSTREVPGMPVSACASLQQPGHSGIRILTPRIDLHPSLGSAPREAARERERCTSGGRHICRMRSRVSFTPLGMQGFDRDSCGPPDSKGNSRSSAATQQKRPAGPGSCTLKRARFTTRGRRNAGTRSPIFLLFSRGDCQEHQALRCQLWWAWPPPEGRLWWGWRNQCVIGSAAAAGIGVGLEPLGASPHPQN